jgi:hypothetical protein
MLVIQRPKQTTQNINLNEHAHVDAAYMCNQQIKRKEIRSPRSRDAKM